jgi:hypothetical protein
MYVRKHTVANAISISLYSLASLVVMIARSEIAEFQVIIAMNCAALTN